MFLKKTVPLLVFLYFISALSTAQNDTVQLKEVIVSTNRISIPYFKTSRTLNLITAKEIKNSTATTIVDVLQQIAGIDIRQRGVDGTQSDLYIRGGSFDQTLILIDGIKMDDAQTGHHTMNAMVSLDNIERIEVIKGPAARVFGQNAFAGAINIVTKKIKSDALIASASYGSYENLKISAGYAKVFENGGVQIHAQKQKSDGYRVNSDFDNTSVFLKSNIKNYNFLVSLSERKFGAENFYTSNPDWKEYEETQTSLFAISTKYYTKNLIIKPRIYWRRNQDMFLLKRFDPSFFRNLHISNKIAAETNFELTSKLGKTGFGLDLNKVFLSSNNLGNHNRLMLTSFLEHRIQIGNKLDVTPGLAFTYFSDFDAQLFPGLDVGFSLSDYIKVYGNIGYTYRIPTFTDLYYSDPGTEGNANLEPESALSEEIGFKYTTTKLQFNLAFFNRSSDNLIDYTKENEADKWKAQNFSKVNTKGFETSINYKFKIGSYNQYAKLGYNFIDDDIKQVDVAFTRYGLNSLKHQLTSSIHTQFLPYLDQSLSFRFVERTNGETYNLVDAKVRVKFNKLEITANANNIFNTEYIEQGLVPMPKGNFMFGVLYNFL
ncbi:TonB-dependent receptor [Aureibaculum marinum]|uniref:TonB-dependent receptor n=1 Tax=Aureibaculum marinum TaxID=2487930 RepID=A0A3N4P5G4_9FLAO|nr:TonB-dependent receptor [Aureibaculum marinum]RPD99880.1 TonB-dependent receptor [Aureibaculum marinum]